MTKGIIIKNATLYLESKTIENGYLFIEDGKIIKISDVPFEMEGEVDVIDGAGLRVLPGFIDAHIHGAKGADTMDATSEALETMARVLPEEGTTSFLATTITQSHEQIERALENIASYTSKSGEATLLGAHLEGPFIHKDKKGAQPGQYIVPGNLALFEKWQQLAAGKIKTVTLAPECDEDGLIPYLYEAGVNVSAGHTTVNFADMKKAVSDGVRQVTHLANAMTGIHHRDVGAVGAAFLLEELAVEVIADEIHLSPEMLDISYRQIGSDRIILITDAMRAKSLAEGMYELGGQAVEVKDGRATLASGSLAGSIVTMIDNVRNMLRIPGVTLQDIVKMTAVNPAKQLKIYDKKGSIATGKDADLLVIDENIEIKYTICQGKVAYEER